MASIFDKIKLSPAQLRSASGRRFDDADALRKTGENARANGVFFGFSETCEGNQAMAVTLKASETDAPPAFVTRLASALEDQIPETQVTFEPLNVAGWYRFLVVSSTFESLGFLEQQDRVWAVADSVLSPEEQHFVGMIVTVTPGEVRP